jgi:hypothetical protein
LGKLLLTLASTVIPGSTILGIVQLSNSLMNGTKQTVINGIPTTAIRKLGWENRSKDDMRRLFKRGVLWMPPKGVLSGREF